MRNTCDINRENYIFTISLHLKLDSKKYNNNLIVNKKQVLYTG